MCWNVPSWLAHARQTCSLFRCKMSPPTKAQQFFSSSHKIQVNLPWIVLEEAVPLETGDMWGPLLEPTETRPLDILFFTFSGVLLSLRWLHLLVSTLHQLGRWICCGSRVKLLLFSSICFSYSLHFFCTRFCLSGATTRALVLEAMLLLMKDTCDRCLKKKKNGQS